MGFAPESPKWLASRGKAEAARNALRSLRSNDPSNEIHELLLLVHASGPGQDSANSPVGLAGLRKCKRSLMIGIGLAIFQQFSGINAVLMYLADICTKTGMSHPHHAAVFSMVAQVLLTLLACVLVERAGRRVLLLFATATMTIACFVLAYYFAAGIHGMWAPSWLALLGICVYIVGFSLGMGPIPWLILGELFPTEIRSSASSLATVTNWACSFLVTLFFKPMVELISKQVTFALFGIVCCTCFVFVFGLVPETKGKAIEEILVLLGCRFNSKPSHDARSYGSLA